MKKKLIVGAVAALASSALVASPALATTWDGSDIYAIPGDTTSLPYYELEANAFNYAGLWTQALIDGEDSSLFDGQGFFVGEEDDYFDCDPSGASVTTATDGSGDIILTCGSQALTSGGTTLDAVLEFRMYSDHKTTRTRLIMTNNTGSTVSGWAAGRSINMYVDEGTNLAWTTTGGSNMSKWPDANGPSEPTIGDGDYSFVVTAPPSVWTLEDNHQPYYSAYGNATAEISPIYPAGTLGGDAQSDNASDTQIDWFQFGDIADGASVQLIWMSREYDYSDDEATALASANVAVADAEANVWDFTTDTQLFAGVTDPSEVKNWGAQTTTPPSTPELPNTGRNQGEILLGVALSLAAIVLGGVVVASRRRKA